MVDQAKLEEWRPLVRNYVDDCLRWNAVYSQSPEERAACFDEAVRRAEPAGVEVSGIWIRKRGLGDNAHVEVLAEVGDEFRRIFRQRVDSFTDGEVSHIVEDAGIVNAPPDDLGSETEKI